MAYELSFIYISVLQKHYEKLRYLIQKELHELTLTERYSVHMQGSKVQNIFPGITFFQISDPLVKHRDINCGEYFFRSSSRSIDKQ